jgi:glycosyltransferase involved in cell wall biosynthesis
MNTLLSIIIPNYNGSQYLAECLKSVTSNLDPTVELIFVDGDSSDRSMNIVESFSVYFAKIVSEKDSGQSDAINKGFNMATGKYVTWLNSDDIIYPGMLSKLLMYLRNNDFDWVACNMAYLDSSGCIIKCCRTGSFESVLLKLGLLNVFGPSTIVRRSLYHLYGPLREDFHYCMDTEYWHRLALAGIRYIRFPDYFWGLRLHSNAKTASVIINATTPEKMSKEFELYQTMYNINPFLHRFAVFLAKISRSIRGVYIRSLFDTIKFKGIFWESFRQ